MPQNMWHAVAAHMHCVPRCLACRADVTVILAWLSKQMVFQGFEPSQQFKIASALDCEEVASPRRRRRYVKLGWGKASCGSNGCCWSVGVRAQLMPEDFVVREGDVVGVNDDGRMYFIMRACEAPLRHEQPAS